MRPLFWEGRQSEKAQGRAGAEVPWKMFFRAGLNGGVVWQKNPSVFLILAKAPCFFMRCWWICAWFLSDDYLCVYTVLPQSYCCILNAHSRRVTQGLTAGEVIPRLAKARVPLQWSNNVFITHLTADGFDCHGFSPCICTDVFWKLKNWPPETTFLQTNSVCWLWRVLITRVVSTRDLCFKYHFNFSGSIFTTWC